MQADQWLDVMLARFYQFVHGYEQDNFDHERYAGEDPGNFALSRHVHYLKFFMANYAQLFQTRALLADEASREWLDKLILYRLLGHHHIRLLDDAPAQWAIREQVKGYLVSEREEKGLLGQLGNYEVPVDDRLIRFAGWSCNVAWAFFIRQYYFERDGVVIKPEAGDHIIDAGACFGDTALAFAASAGPSGRIYSFDMLPAHCRILRENIANNPDIGASITVLPYGVSDEDKNIDLVLDQGNAINPGARLNTDSFPIRRIDSLADEKVIERVDFIKMDIEGSELAALRGAEQTLRRWRPKLAISIYHDTTDYISIPQYLASLDLGYRFYLDHYTIHQEETVLYATAR
ncbi:FkbM family methyltransferase [Chitinimonas lacunae]|uniref:FkbM family methyltransferase n=1 Tax=Chitinimonas lacunae TaxID=1963018 RepID=A0ABV8MV65_9NEIS